MLGGVARFGGVARLDGETRYRLRQNCRYGQTERRHSELDRYCPARRSRYDVLLWFAGDLELPFFPLVASGSPPALVAYINGQQDRSWCLRCPRRCCLVDVKEACIYPNRLSYRRFLSSRKRISCCFWLLQKLSKSERLQCESRTNLKRLPSAHAIF